MGSTNLVAIFLTGLFVGGLTCMAVQGGLLAATIAQREEDRLKEKVKKGSLIPILSFLIAKLAAYTVLGFLLGWLGSAFQLSLTARTVIQFAAAIFMVGTAFNILQVHPIFRYFIIQPPRFLTRIVRNQSKSGDFFGPAILGAFTVFIPCGTTQAMMALAIASGNPMIGGAILFTFVLGTSPIFFILGFLATKLGENLQQKFMKFAAYAIIILALFNTNNALALTGSNFTFESALRDFYCAFANCANPQTNTISTPNAGLETTINKEGRGYTPNYLTIKAGSPVTIRLINTGGSGCTQAFTIPRLGIQKVVPLGSSDTITFTAPSRPGTQLAFMCGMGMFRGVINVI